MISRSGRALLVSFLVFVGCFEIASTSCHSALDGHTTTARSLACVLLRLRGGGLRDKKRAEKYHKLKEVGRKHAETEIDSEEEVRKEVTQRVQHEVAESLARGNSEKELAAKRERNRTKKKLRKQRGSLSPSTKNQIRSLERTLARKGDKIPPDVQQKMKDKIESLQSTYEEAKLVEKEREYSQRYRKVKFFERQKVERKLKSIKHDLEDESLTSKERRRLEKKRKLLLEDLQYVLYFPRDMKYVSLLNNPRNVTVALRSTPGFAEKMDRARQIVLAYRAAKLNQKRGSDGKSSEPKLEPSSHKRIHLTGKAGVSASSEDDIPAKRRKVSDESDDIDAERAPSPDPKEFLEAMRLEQSKNLELFEGVDASRESDPVGKDEDVISGDVAELGTDGEGKASPDGASESEQHSTVTFFEPAEPAGNALESVYRQRDHAYNGKSSESEDGQDLDGLKGFFDDSKPKVEVRHKAENCLGPGDEDDPPPTNSLKRGGKTSRTKSHKTQKFCESDAGGIDEGHIGTADTSSLAADMQFLANQGSKKLNTDHSSPHYNGILPNIPQAKGYVDFNPLQAMVVSQPVTNLGTTEESARSVDDDVEQDAHGDHLFLDDLNAQMAEQEEDEMDNNGGMPERAEDLHAFGMKSGIITPGLEAERQKRLKQFEEMERINEQEAMESSSDIPDKNTEPEKWARWQKARNFLRSAKKQAIRDMRRNYAGAAQVSVEDIEADRNSEDDDDEMLDKKVDAKLDETVLASKHAEYAEFSKMEFDTMQDAMLAVIRKRLKGPNPLENNDFDERNEGAADSSDEQDGEEEGNKWRQIDGEKYVLEDNEYEGVRRWHTKDEAEHLERAPQTEAEKTPTQNKLLNEAHFLEQNPRTQSQTRTNQDQLTTHVEAVPQDGLHPQNGLSNLGASKGDAGVLDAGNGQAAEAGLVKDHAPPKTPRWKSIGKSKREARAANRERGAEGAFNLEDAADMLKIPSHTAQVLSPELRRRSGTIQEQDTKRIARAVKKERAAEDAFDILEAVDMLKTPARSAHVSSHELQVRRSKRQVRAADREGASEGAFDLEDAAGMLKTPVRTAHVSCKTPYSPRITSYKRETPVRTARASYKTAHSPRITSYKRENQIAGDSVTNPFLSPRVVSQHEEENKGTYGNGLNTPLQSAAKEARTPITSQRLAEVMNGAESNREGSEMTPGGADSDERRRAEHVENNDCFVTSPKTPVSHSSTTRSPTSLSIRSASRDSTVNIKGVSAVPEGANPLECKGTKLDDGNVPQTPQHIRDIVGRIDSFFEGREARKKQLALQRSNTATEPAFVVARAAHGARRERRAPVTKNVRELAGNSLRTSGND